MPGVLFQEFIKIKICIKCINVNKTQVFDEQQTFKVIRNHLSSGLLETWKVISQIDEKPIAKPEQVVQFDRLQRVFQPEINKILLTVT